MGQQRQPSPQSLRDGDERHENDSDSMMISSPEHPGRILHHDSTNVSFHHPYVGGVAVGGQMNYNMNQISVPMTENSMAFPPFIPNLMLVPNDHQLQAQVTATQRALQYLAIPQTSLFNNYPFAHQLPPQPALTVQERVVPPVFNGVNPAYPGLKLLRSNPPVYSVDNFLNAEECQFLINAASDSYTPAPVIGPGAGEISSSRTSTTCYLAKEDLPEYMRKVCTLTGKPVNHCELPQVGRYLPSQQYLQHYDAFDFSNEHGRNLALNGGQRVVTILVYLNHVHNGGQTCFPMLDLSIKPEQGMALVFFPATVDGLLDKMALHAALPAVDVKFVSQVWIRQDNYNGQPSKRLSRILDLTVSQGI